MSDASEVDPAAVWRGLSRNQRLVLADTHIRRQGSLRYPWYVPTAKALARRGLLGFNLPGLTDAGRRVVEWALVHAFLTQDANGEWRIHEPPPRRRTREDVARFAALGMTAAEIAREVGVSREAVRQCCLRHGIELVRHRDLPKARSELREEITRLRKRVADLEGS